jgi:hypothetical protein
MEGNQTFSKEYLTQLYRSIQEKPLMDARFRQQPKWAQLKSKLYSWLR